MVATAWLYFHVFFVFVVMLQITKPGSVEKIFMDIMGHENIFIKHENFTNETFVYNGFAPHRSDVQYVYMLHVIWFATQSNSHTIRDEIVQHICSLMISDDTLCYPLLNMCYPVLSCVKHVLSSVILC